MSSPVDRRAIASWCLYDFANSAFTTVVVTFVYASFFTKVIAANEIEGTSQWSQAVALTAISVAFLSPILGAIADRGGYRRRFLLLSTAVCVVATTALFWAGPGQVTMALAIFAVANVAFEMANVFYNAYLPDIAPPDQVGRVSGYGWALGYGGGLVAMAVCLVALIQPEVPWFGFSTEGGENVRATLLLVAAWYAVFSVPMFLFVGEETPTRAPSEKGLVAPALRQLVDTFHELRHYRQIARLLAARLVYNDGLVTIFAFGGIYAVGTFGFSFTELMVFGMVLNIAAGIGAFALGFMDDLLGGKRTIQLSLVGLGAASALAIAAPSKPVFWIAAIGVGIFAGPNQSASRSLLARFVPDSKENEFFGFFAFSGKATAFLGPLLLGKLTTAFESQRAGVSIVVVFFIVGGLILAGLDEKEGIAVAARGGTTASPRAADAQLE